MMTCYNCSASLNIITKKKCSICCQTFCKKCFSQQSPPKACLKCFKIFSGNYTVKDLESYSAKELRNFLIGKQISLDNCFEKSDLIALIVKTYSINDRCSVDLEHQKHVQLLKTKFHQEIVADARLLNSQTFGLVTNSPNTDDTINQSSAFSASNVSADNNNVNIHLQSFSSATLNPNIEEANLLNILPPSYDELSQSENTDMDVTSSSTGVLNQESTVPNEVSGISRNSFAKHEASANNISEKRIKLDDLKDVSDIELLSVRQIKDILTNNFVNYKGCCEKSELSNMVANLFLEHAKNKSMEKLDEISSGDLCKVCMENVIDCVLLGCGHMAVCKYCGKQMAECPICRKYVSRVVHIFRA